MALLTEATSALRRWVSAGSAPLSLAESQARETRLLIAFDRVYDRTSDIVIRHFDELIHPTLFKPVLARLNHHAVRPLMVDERMKLIQTLARRFDTHEVQTLFPFRRSALPSLGYLDLFANFRMGVRQSVSEWALEMVSLHRRDVTEKEYEEKLGADYSLPQTTDKFRNMLESGPAEPDEVDLLRTGRVHYGPNGHNMINGGTVINYGELSDLAAQYANARRVLDTLTRPSHRTSRFKVVYVT